MRLKLSTHCIKQAFKNSLEFIHIFMKINYWVPSIDSVKEQKEEIKADEIQ